MLLLVPYLEMFIYFMIYVCIQYTFIVSAYELCIILCIYRKGYVRYSCTT